MSTANLTSDRPSRADAGRTALPATAPRATASDTKTPIAQLSRRGVFAIWAGAAVPMGVLTWIAAPLLAGALGGPSALQRALLFATTLGLVWQFVLTLVLVYREQRTLRWSVIREVVWLRAPQSPKTGRRGGRMWLAVPLLLTAFVTAFFAAQKLIPSVPIRQATMRALSWAVQRDMRCSMAAGVGLP